MGMPLETPRRWTASEVRELIAAQPSFTPRYELVGGELLVTPSPGMPHQLAVGGLHVPLDIYLRRRGLGRCVISPSDVELEPEDVRQPDLYVISLQELRRVHLEGMPVRQLLLAIEVISASSGRYDRVIKRPGFQRHAGEYWIVDLDARLAERWRPRDERPEILTRTLVWTPDTREPFELDLVRFFAEVYGEVF